MNELLVNSFNSIEKSLSSINEALVIIQRDLKQCLNVNEHKGDEEKKKINPKKNSVQLTIDDIK